VAAARRADPRPHLGAREQTAARGLGTATAWVGSRQYLLKLLAPIVMAYLAKRMFTQRSGQAVAVPQASPQVLGDVLGQEERSIAQQGGLGGGLLGKVLDRDADGDVDFSDLIGLGGSVLGGPQQLIASACVALRAR